MRRRKRTFFWIIFLTIIIVVGIFIADSIFPSSLNISEEGSPNGLVINEVMTSNQYSFKDSSGESPDWIELYNSSNGSINLADYCLTDDAKDLKKFKFPSCNIGSGEYMVVYASGKEDEKSQDGILRMGYKLSQSGVTLVLSDPSGNVIQQLDVSQMPSDMSYGRVKDGSYGYYSIPTPGKANGDSYNTVPEFDTSAVESVVKINEVMPSNKYSILDLDGERQDWAEIINTGKDSINLQGYGFSDDASDRMKWIFPSIDLAPGKVVLIFLSGKDMTKDTEIHAGFRLSSKNSSLLLSNPQGIPIDVIKWGDIPGNVSLGRDSKNTSSWLYYPAPTPGKENTTKGFAEIDKNTEKYLPTP